ncbi:MAG TPA: hypothetical protein VIM07_14090 [Chitinophagaceae bacterium]
MKLFIVTCLKEYREDVYKIFKQANIHVFSATDVIGFKDNQTLNLLEDWFASGDEKFDSMMLFSFTSDENAAHGMDLIKKYNEESETVFPVRAFIVPVEKTSY